MTFTAHIRIHVGPMDVWSSEHLAGSGEIRQQQEAIPLSSRLLNLVFSKDADFRLLCNSLVHQFHTMRSHISGDEVQGRSQPAWGHLGRPPINISLENRELMVANTQKRDSCGSDPSGHEMNEFGRYTMIWKNGGVAKG
jgi:hypothetical protein